MKKQIKKILVLLLLVVLVAGCSFKTDVTMKIDSNKDVEVSILYIMDDEMIDSMISLSDESKKDNITDDDRWKYLEGDSGMDMPEGYKTEKYDKDGFKGYKATKKAGTLDDISVASSSARVNIFNEDSDADMFKGELFIKDGNKYKSNMTVDLGDSAADMESYESYGAAFEFNLVIELPVKPTSNNATSVSKDGKTLTYNLLKTKDIEFEFELDGKASKGGKSSTNSNELNINNKSSNTEKTFNLGLPVLIAIAVGGLVLVIGIVILIIVLATRKPKQAVVTTEPTQETPVVETPQEEVKEESVEEEKTEESKED